MQHWLWLGLAIVLEVSGTTCMKLSQGFSRLVPSVAMFVFYGVSFVALAAALRKIDVSVAYALWAGAGTALIAVIGMTYFREPATAMRMVGISFVVLGVIMLHLSGSDR